MPVFLSTLFFHLNTVEPLESGHAGNRKGTPRFPDYHYFPDSRGSTVYCFPIISICI